jgi:transcriptional/translational regulatory protein YebC/TACO1
MGGGLGEAGCVSWLFQKKGYISFDKNVVDENKIMELALDVGAEDISDDGNVIEVLTDLSGFEKVRKAFEDQSVPYMVAEISMIPQTSVKLEGKSAETMLKLMEALDDSEDVQKVYANFDISMEEMERLSQ